MLQYHNHSAELGVSEPTALSKPSHPHTGDRTEKGPTSKSFLAFPDILSVTFLSCNLNIVIAIEPCCQSLYGLAFYTKISRQQDPRFFNQKGMVIA